MNAAVLQRRRRLTPATAMRRRPAPDRRVDHMASVEIRALSKHFGAVAAVKDLSFDVHAGRVTGFLGPNGAGKTTTLRALLGLVRPSTGSATFAGQAYDQLKHPSAAVG